MTVHDAVAFAVPCRCGEAPADPYEATPRPRRVGAAATVPRTLRVHAAPQTRRVAAFPAQNRRALVAPPATLPPTEEAALRADALGRSLCAALEQVTAPLACLAASLLRERSWCLFGFARAGDFTRERFGRSGRWLRDLAALHEALARLDGLAAALAGDDGGVPLGRRRALLVARVADRATLSSWIAQARQLTVRELQAAVAGARAASAGTDSSPPPDSATEGDAPHTPTGPKPEWPRSSRPSDAGPSLAPDDLDEDEDRSLVNLAAPRAVVAAFDEAVDLYRAVEGGEATVTSFVEALVAEAAAGDPVDGIAADAHRSSQEHGPSGSLIERSLARSTDRWRHLPRSTDASRGLAPGRSTLARLATITRAGDSGTCAERVARLQELLAMENDIEGHLGRLLVTMGEQNAWNRLRFAGLAHYAQERLGLSRTTALSRARAARLAGRFPSLRSAYERREIGLEATLLVGRILSAARPHAANGAVPAESSPERTWVRHAAAITFKRLRDEARALDRFRAFGIDGPAAASSPAGPTAASSDGPSSSAAPLSDVEWHRSLRRERGTTRRRVAALGFIALGAITEAPRSAGEAAPPGTSIPFDPTTALIPEPDVFLRLTLPDDLAGRFLAAIESARRNLTAQADAIPWDEDWPPPAAATSEEPSGSAAPFGFAAPSRLAARTFSIRARRLPSWVGLLALIEDFVATWDPDEPEARASDDPILARDGWRCMAPGCTSRANLELHHVIYRSRGGGDESRNIVTLCRFHHQRGEHGDLARLVGHAPLDLTWRLGSEAVAPATEASGQPPGRAAPTVAWYRNERRIAPPAVT